MLVAMRFAFAVVLGAIACGAYAGDAEEEQARNRIEGLQQAWVEAVARSDVETIVGFYAEDAWFLPAGSPPLHGHEAIRAWWQETLSDPPWQSLTFGPTEIVFGESGDLAYDVGTSRMTVAGDDGETVQKGKYLVVWERIDGEWKVVADAFNAN